MKSLSLFALLGILMLYACAPTSIPTSTRKVAATQRATVTIPSTPTVTPKPSITPSPSPSFRVYSFPTMETVTFQAQEAHETSSKYFGKISAASFSFNKSKAAICHAGNSQIVFWDMKDNKQTSSLPGIYECHSVAFSPDNKNLATGFLSGGRNEQLTLVLWDVGTATLTRGIVGFEKNRSVVFSPDSKYLAKANTCSIMIYEVKKIPSFDNHLLVVHSGQSNDPTLTFGCRDDYYHTSVDISPDGKQIAGGTNDDEVLLWNFASRKLASIWKHSGNKDSRVSIVRFSHNGNFLASVSLETGIKVWDISSNTQTSRIFNDSQPIYSIAFSKDDNILLAASTGVVNLWDIKSKQKLCQLTANTGNILAIDFSSDENSVYGISADGHVLIWEIGVDCKSPQ